MDDAEISDDDLTLLTRIVREADQEFQRVGGSSRHWVRDCFWPILQRHGLTLVRTPDAKCPTCGGDLRGSFPECIDCQVVTALKAGDDINDG